MSELDQAKAERRAIEAQNFPFTRPPVIDMNAIEDAIRKTPTVDLPIPATAAERHIDKTLAERKTVHGDFTDDAHMAQGLKNLMRQGVNWARLQPFQAEALDQMQTKIARILAGDCDHPDHWRDLQGYPRLVEERLK